MTLSTLGMRSSLSGVSFTMPVVSQARPDLSPGTLVWHGRAVYVAELVERHGTEWVAGVVAVGDAHRSKARLCFIPIRELDWS